MKKTFFILLLAICTLSAKGQQPSVITDYTEKTTWLSIHPNIKDRDWTARIDNQNRYWAYVDRYQDMIRVVLSENKGKENRLLQIHIEEKDSLLHDLYVEQRYNPLPFEEIDFTVGAPQQEIQLNIPTKETPRFRTPAWIEVKEREQSDYVFSISANNTSIARTDTIFITDADSLETRPLLIFQHPDNNDFTTTSTLAKDEKLSISHGECSSEHPGTGIELSFDGNLESNYHSAWDNTANDYFPITLTYHFSQPEEIDYFIYIPRLDGGNGIYKKTSIFVQRKGNNAFEHLMDYDFKGRPGNHHVRLKEQQKDVVAFRILVYSGTGGGQGLASCAEMEFYRDASYDKDYLKLFTDASCSQLRKRVTRGQISKCQTPFFRDLAMWMKEGNQPNEFRVQYYKAWGKPETIAQANGCNPVGKWDNPTGISAIKGEPLVLLVDCAQADSIRLGIQHLSAPKGKDGFGGMEYPLHEGINVIYPQKDGLCYIIYQTDVPQEAPDAKIHIIGGHTNGYFDIEKHLYADGSSRWRELLEKAGDQYFDVVSPYVHFTFNTSLLRKHVADIVPLLEAYDTMVRHEQEFQGFRKYNRMLANRVYFYSSRATYGVAWAKPYAIGYNEEFMINLLDANRFKTTECWGPAHELGHMLQIRPSFLWKGITEVSNNILSMEIQRLWGNPSRLQEKLPESETYQDIYERAMNNSFVHRPPYANVGDWFDRLVPLWQLRLYLMEVHGQTDFYKDLYERCIQMNKATYSHGQWQLAFVYNCCITANTDLRPFFEKWGWLTPTEQIVNDYGTDTLSVTQRDIETLNEEISSLHLPLLTDAVEFLTDKNLHLYQHPQTPMTGNVLYNNEGTIHITDSQGIVAFEVFNENTLVGVSHNTIFKLPTNQSYDFDKLRVIAVLPNGKRIEYNR